MWREKPKMFSHDGINCPISSTRGLFLLRLQWCQLSLRYLQHLSREFVCRQKRRSSTSGGAREMESSWLLKISSTYEKRTMHHMLNVQRGSIQIFSGERNLWHWQFSAFLDATTHLYKRPCPSVRPSVRLSRVIFKQWKSHIPCSDDDEILHGPKESRLEFENSM